MSEVETSNCEVPPRFNWHCWTLNVTDVLSRDGIFSLQTLVRPWAVSKAKHCLTMPRMKPICKPIFHSHWNLVIGVEYTGVRKIFWYNPWSLQFEQQRSMGLTLEADYDCVVLLPPPSHRWRLPCSLWPYSPGWHDHFVGQTVWQAHQAGIHPLWHCFQPPPGGPFQKYESFSRHFWEGKREVERKMITDWQEKGYRRCLESRSSWL